ncbi:Argininosuccinate lyase (plasmid) [Variovorax sp. SRS16]|uniref:Bug family tripartite tricarboxylate transporter substrate binding protein n=1 Tax=Variovorax sp. SRS16 TaxID=282217 RepID=UPI001318F20F|nr:tripartite tricarboxylate transporter substrate binding protein [Variovorax sp. SRS16]VTU45611.1 Argininosuccinate lyase [Variovorax sp. SRS16]
MQSSRNISRRDALATLALGAGGGLLAASGNARADNAPWPNHSIRWVIPYAAGGTSDIIVRAAAQKLGERFGQAVIVDNKTGAGGNIGTDFVAKSPPDGYTWVLGNPGPMAVNVSLYASLPFDPQKDLVPITLLVAYPNLIVANLEKGPKSMQELIERAKTEPMAYAGNGVGTSLHLTGELLAQTAHIKLTHVPYRGEAPGLTDTMAGVVPFQITPIASGLPLVKAGKLRGLAVTGAQRSPLLPDVPTVAESGLPGFEVTGWVGVLVPRGTPQPIVDRMVKEFDAVMKLPDIQRVVTNDMASFVPTLGPAYFTQFIASETERWRKVVRAANLKAE